jgi:hypothetical protein
MVIRWHRRSLVGLVGWALLAAAGCQSGHRATAWGTDNSPNLLFSPPCTGLATRDVPRNDWPSTEVFGDTSERITFQARITDVQQLSHHGQDYSIRQFNSVRSGTRRR